MITYIFFMYQEKLMYYYGYDDYYDDYYYDYDGYYDDYYDNYY